LIIDLRKLYCLNQKQIIYKRLNKILTSIITLRRFLTMAEHLEDCSFKRLTDAFPVPMLKYLNVRHDMTKPYKTTLEITNNNK